MIPSLLFIAALSSCPVTAKITIESYTGYYPTTIISCVDAFRFQNGLVTLDLPSDTIFIGNFDP